MVCGNTQQSEAFLRIAKQRNSNKQNFRNTCLKTRHKSQAGKKVSKVTKSQCATAEACKKRSNKDNTVATVHNLPHVMW